MEANKTSKKTTKSKEEIKSKFTDLTNNGEINENNDTQERASQIVKSEDAATAIKELEDIIKSKKSNIIWLACQQGKIFQKFKEKENFINMVNEFGVGKSTIVFKIDQ